MIAIVYATNSGMVRRQICPATDEDFSSGRHQLYAGESYIIYSPEQESVTMEDIEAAVSSVIGRPIVNHVCAVVVDGIVDRLIMADPEIDSLPDVLLVDAGPTVCVGDTYENGEFVMGPDNPHLGVESEPQPEFISFV